MTMPALTTRLLPSGHAIGIGGLILIGLALAFAAHGPLVLLPAGVGLLPTALYLRTLWRMARNRPLTLRVDCDSDSLTVSLWSGSRQQRSVRYSLSTLTDCGLTPVDSGFSSLWHPYVGTGTPPQRHPLPTGCLQDLRRLPADQYAALLDQVVTLLEQHRPQALQRLRQSGAAYG